MSDITPLVVEEIFDDELDDIPAGKPLDVFTPHYNQNKNKFNTKNKNMSDNFNQHNNGNQKKKINLTTYMIYGFYISLFLNLCFVYIFYKPKPPAPTLSEQVLQLKTINTETYNSLIELKSIINGNYK